MTDHVAVLLPCPFCGADPSLEDHRTIWAVKCGCGVSMLGERAPEPDGTEPESYWDGIRQTAIDAWNRRAAVAERDALVARLGELEQAWRHEADEIAKNNWACNANSIRARADDLARVVKENTDG